MVKYNNWPGHIILLLLILLFLSTGAIFTTASATHKITKSVVDQGGAVSQSTDYHVVDAIGQSSPVGVTVSSNYRVASGFFSHSAGGVTPPELPTHWDYTENTDNNAIVVLPTTANPNIDGTPLSNGDYIGVFTPAGLCCGYRQWQGANLSLTIWGDDTQTSDIDGFRAGEEVHYRVYRLSTQKEWTSVIVSYSTGSGVYAANAYMVLSQFDISDVMTIALNFNHGWNMFSINVDPVDPDVGTVMIPVVARLVIVKNGAGQAYIPEYGINDIGDLQYTEGYQAYFTQATPLNVQGQAVNLATPISLPAGWNMIGYLPRVPIDAATALASISSQLVIAKNNNGQTYIPEYGINDIGNMEPGQGYQVYLTAPGTLTYPSGRALHKIQHSTDDEPDYSKMVKSLTEHFQFTGDTGENMTVVVPVDCAPKYSDGTPLEMGDEIGVFTSDSLCCGAIVWENRNQAMAIWGDNVQTDSVDGFHVNDTLRFCVWRKSEDLEYPASVKYRFNDSPVYLVNAYSVLTELVADLTVLTMVKNEDPVIPMDFKLLQNHPNPFNPETTIKYQLPQATEIALSIYDIQGREIRQLAQGTFQAGYHTITWDGRDYAGSIVASGMYFYRIEAKTLDTRNSSYMDVKKMILMK